MFQRAAFFFVARKVPQNTCRLSCGVSPNARPRKMDEIRARGMIDAALRDGGGTQLRLALDEIVTHDYQLFADVTNNRSFGEYLVASSRSARPEETADAFSWLLRISLPRLDVDELLETLNRRNSSDPTVASAVHIARGESVRRSARL